MIDKTVLEAMSQMNIEDVDPESLVDIQEVKIDTSLPAPARMLNYLEQIKNPYCFKCGKTPVKIKFSENGGDLAEKLKSYFISLKR